MMGPLEAAPLAVHRFEQVDPPDGLANRYRLRRVDRSLQVTAFEHPEFQPDSVLRAFLALAGLGVDEVEVAEQYTDALEAERAEHE